MATALLALWDPSGDDRRSLAPVRIAVTALFGLVGCPGIEPVSSTVSIRISSAG
jgi:hypothetical protein